MTNPELKAEIDTIELLKSASKFNEALDVGFSLLERSEIINDINLQAIVFNSIANVYQQLADYTKALNYYHKSLQINEECGNIASVAKNYGNIGLVYVNLSDYTKGLEYYEKSIQINLEIDSKGDLIVAYGNIGNVYKQLSENNKAIDYFKKAIQIAVEIENKVGLARNLGNLGTIYIELSEFDLALESLNNALRTFEEIDDIFGQINVYVNFGNLYNRLKNHTMALEYYEKVLNLNDHIKSKYFYVSGYGNLGVVYSQLKEFTKALEFTDKSYTYALEIDSKFFQQICLQLYSDIYEKMGNIQQAFTYYKQYIDLKDKISSEEIQQQSELFNQRRLLEEDEKARQLKLARFQEQERILHNILPVNIADRIIKQETFIADHFHSVSVLFMDLVGFTSLASIAPPKQLVYLLDAIFQKADEVVETFGLEKIKTIGDGYLAVANVTSPLEEHQKATALAALQLIETMRDFTVNIPSDLGDIEWINDMNDIEIRIGIHTGEVVAGIIGKNKYTYDLWGDAVNVASRMESNSEAGRIHISEAFAKSIEQNPEFFIIPRGEINIKGKGTMNTYWLEKSK